MNLLDAVKKLDQFDQRAVLMFLPGAGAVGPSTEVAVVVPPAGLDVDDPVEREKLGPPGHRFLIEVQFARKTLKCWADWVPGDPLPPEKAIAMAPEKAVEMVVLMARSAGGLRPPAPSAEEEIERARGDGRAELKLRGRRLEALPESIGVLTSLETLDLSQNALEDLPGSISNLSKLRKLTLRDNRFRRLPESICRLANLQFLDVSGNALERLPDSIGELSTLVLFNAARNKIGELPPSLGRIKKLMSLSLAENPIAVSLEGIDLPELLSQGSSRFPAPPR